MITIPYLYQQTSSEDIEIEDLGNVCLKCFSAYGAENWLSVRCSLGWCSILQVYPMPLENKIVGSFTVKFFKVEYKESKIIKIINNFINDPNKQIVQVFYADYNDLMTRLHELKLED